MIKTTPYSRRDEKWDLPVIQVKSKEEKMRLHLISSRTDSAESSRWVCLVPFIMIVSGSFSSESAIIQNGFSLLPQDFSLEAYKTVFKILWLSPRIRHDHRSDHRRNGTWSAAADYDSLCTVT